MPPPQEKIKAQDFPSKINKIPTGSPAKQSKIYFSEGNTCISYMDPGGMLIDQNELVNYFNSSETMSKNVIIKAIIFTSINIDDQPCVGVYLFDNDQSWCEARFYDVVDGLYDMRSDNFLIDSRNDNILIRFVMGSFIGLEFYYPCDTYIIVEEDT